MWEIASKFAGALFGAIVNGLVRLFTARQTRADQIELGQDRQENVQHRVADKATEAMAEAAAEPRDEETTKGRMSDGTF